MSFNPIKLKMYKYYLKLKKKILHHAADQLAIVLYTIKHEYRFPIKYGLVLMSVMNVFLRLFVTENIMIQTLFSIVFTSLTHLLAVCYILYYIIPNEKLMEIFINFIKKHRKDPEV